MTSWNTSLQRMMVTDILIIIISSSTLFGVRRSRAAVTSVGCCEGGAARSVLLGINTQARKLGLQSYQSSSSNMKAQVLSYILCSLMFDMFVFDSWLWCA